MSRKKAQLLFQPSGRRGSVPTGISLLEASQRIGGDIEALCGGQGRCGKCRVKIQAGSFNKPVIESKHCHAGPWRKFEAEFIGNAEKKAGERLACAAKVQGDMIVYVPEASRAGKQVVSKSARPLHIDHDPAVKVYPVSIPSPTMAASASDVTRLTTALGSRYGLTDLRIDLPALQQLPGVVKSDGSEVSAVVWQDQEIIAVNSEPSIPAAGIAIDIGTTTMAAYICDLSTMAILNTATMMNPQVTYGEDVLSRISYTMNHGDGLELLHRVLMEGLNRLVDLAIADTTIADGIPIQRQHIVDLTLCGNSAMTHFLLNLDPAALGAIPFNLVNERSLDIKARDLGLNVNPGAYAFILPCAAGFIGGDIVSALLVETPEHGDSVQFLIDIGTNGEIVLGNARRLVCCSCATGPALEGAQIEWGMRAARGAIERVRIDPVTFEVNYKVIGKKELAGLRRSRTNADKRHLRQRYPGRGGRALPCQYHQELGGIQHRPHNKASATPATERNVGICSGLGR